MGKKSLLAPTAEKKTSDGKRAEKKKKPQTSPKAAKKAAPKSSKKNTSLPAAKKKVAGGSVKTKKAVSRKIQAKKKAPPRRTSSPKKSIRKDTPEPKQEIQKPPMSKVGPERQTLGRPVSEKTPIGSSLREIEAGTPPKKPVDSYQRMVTFCIAGLVVLLAMVIWASALNVEKFYVKPVDGELEIWKGRFSPKGVKKIFTFKNSSVPTDLKEAYSEEEAFSIIFNGIINDADALLNTEGMPNFDLIRDALVDAQPFAVSPEMSQLLQKRLDKIDMMAMVYKADILAGKGTAANLKAARESLEKAAQLNLDEAEMGFIRQKIVWVDQKLAEIGEL